MSKRLIATLLLAAAPFLAVPHAHAQGLAERRGIQEYQDKVFPDLKKQISDAAGFDVKVTVNWDKLALPGKSEHYLDEEFITQIFFRPLIAALKDVTKDAMGKNALKDKLKEIVVTYEPGTAPISDYKNGWKFDGGVLTLNGEPWANSGGPDTDNFKDRMNAIKQNLEEKL